MLISTSLSTLLLGLSIVTARVAPSSFTLDPVDSRAPVRRPRRLYSGEIQDHDRNGRSPASVPAQLNALPRRRRDGRRNGLFSRDASCSPETTTVCSSSNGTGLMCPGCSTCCPAAEGGYQCCQQGFKCCTTTTGAGACCPDDGSDCADGVCGSGPRWVQDSRISDDIIELMIRPRLPVGAVLETVTLTTTVTSLTASRTIGMFPPFCSSSG